MVTGEIVLVGSCSGTFFALDRASGEEIWRYDTAQDGTPASFHGDPLVTGELVVVGSDVPQDGSGHLYAFDRSTGEVRWKIPIAVPVDILPSGDYGLTMSMTGEALSVELETGRIRWRFSEPGGGLEPEPQVNPVLVGDRFYLASRSGNLFALDVATGEVVWQRELGSEPNTSFVRWRDRLFVGTFDGLILSVDPLTGDTEPAFDTRGMPFGFLVPAGDCLLALWWNASAEDYGRVEAPYTFACLQPAAGAIVWQQPSLSEWMTYRPLVVDGSAIVGDSQGLLLAFETSDGGERWHQQLGRGLRGLSADEQRIYVGSLPGVVWALDRQALGAAE